MSKLSVDERAEYIESYGRHKQRHHRKPMSGKCTTRRRRDKYNDKNLKILGTRSQGRTHKISEDKKRAPKRQFGVDITITKTASSTSNRRKSAWQA